jgi:hypothetical protein
MDRPNSKELDIIIPAFRMHSQIFDNLFDGIEQKDVLTRIEGRTNHIIWMTGNLVNCRYWLAGTIGITDVDPNDHLFGMAKALDESLAYPSLKELQAQWHIISPKVYKRLVQTSDETLAEPIEIGMKVDFVEQNKLNMIGMTIDRESYLFGQIGLMRRILGYPGVSYTINNALDY